jgi:hypothetical protein
MTPTVGIVVLNWGGGARTIDCIEALRAQPLAEKFIVVVDNRSEAEERETLVARYGHDPSIEFCLNDANRGYTGGMNAGLERARARNADVVVLVTQDVVFGDGALAALVGAAKSAPDVGIVGPLVVDSADPSVVLSAGERVFVPLLCVPRGWMRYRRRRQGAYPVESVLGCALSITRACMESVAGFDERFFAYYEEVDLCLRARRSGFRVLCEPKAVVHHDGSRGFGRGFTPVSAELKTRNLLLLMRRWARPLDYVVLIPTFVALLVASTAAYLARGHIDIVGAMLRGLIAGLRGEGGRPGALEHAA